MPPPAPVPEVGGRIAFGLFKKRVCLVPTWRALLLLFIGAVAVIWLVMVRVHPFLATSDPLLKGVLVVEGWLPDYTLEQAIAHFHTGNYTFMYVTGGPIEYGAPLSEYKTYAQAAAASLACLGMETNKLQAVPAPEVKQDRTYTSAVALKRWFQVHNVTVDAVTVVSQDLHARRSRLLFATAFGQGVKVGSLAVPSRAYDPRRWWRSSQGVRGVIAELTAYLYARFLFKPSAA